LIENEKAPLCPTAEMWVAAAYNNWIHVGSYCATFKHKIGAKVKKNDDRYYNAFKKEPYGNIG